MKFMLSLCIAILSAALLLSCLPLSGEEALYASTIRLHILAASDSKKDQAQKYIVRDAVLSSLEEVIGEADSYASARTAVQNALSSIEATAAMAAGNCPVHATLSREWYPVRYYENFTLPAGEYTSLRIILGEGAGQNWWCVLFPQLCTAHASEEALYEEFIAAGFTPEQYRLIQKDSGIRYKIRFRILELIEELLHGD